MNRIILLILLFNLIQTTAIYPEANDFQQIEKIEDLDSIASFSFSIVSDNKGRSPYDSDEFNNMVEWISESGDIFVIGLGDHVKTGWDNSFLKFLKENHWWYSNFYPNVADGENEYYGEGQDDWGAGAPILETVDLFANAKTIIRDNGCEYYSVINWGDIFVHLIQLHYSDSPPDDSIAFNEDTKNYLFETLNNIDKGPEDIIIICAHSRYGSWVNFLSEERQKIILNKADLILSATTHFFERIEVPGYEDFGALCINTGSITYPSKYCPGGFVQVHVLEDPLTLIVQYINAEVNFRELQHEEYAFVKVVGGENYSYDFREAREDEDINRILGYIMEEYTEEELSNYLIEVCKNLTGAQEVYLEVQSGLQETTVKYYMLWDVFPFNNEIYVLTLTDNEVLEVFEGESPFERREFIKLAINSYYGDYIIDNFDIPESRIYKPGITEHELLNNLIISSDDMNEEF